jgi:hypothetical protein
MHLNQDRPSATIYEFPRGGRAGQQQREVMRNVANASQQQSAQINYDGWYHEEAMREQERGNQQG